MSKKSERAYSPRWLKEHREYLYQQALGKLIDGKADIEYVEHRWNKVKEIRK